MTCRRRRRVFTGVRPNRNLSSIPMLAKKVELMHIDGMGECVRAILKDPAGYDKQVLGLATDSVTVDEIVALFNKHFGPARKFINFGVR